MESKQITYDDINRILRTYNVGYGISDGLPTFIEAFTHSSIKNKESNERLAFLGDAIIKAITTDYLCDRFEGSSNGVLTELRQSIENKKKQAELCKILGLNRYFQAEGIITERMHSELYESFIGAMYTVVGFDDCSQLVTAIIKRHQGVWENKEEVEEFIVEEFIEEENKEVSKECIKKNKEKDEGWGPLGIGLLGAGILGVGMLGAALFSEPKREETKKLRT